MKKNLLTILILALLVVNLAMTGFLTFSVMSTNYMIANLVSDIAAVLELEAGGGVGTGGGSFGKTAADISVADSAFYEISGDSEMTIELAKSEDGKSHYAIVDLVLSMNKNHEDYATYGTDEQLGAMKGKMQSIIQGVVSSYTIDTAKSSEKEIRAAILEKLQEMYNSDFIYDISFSKFICS